LTGECRKAGKILASFVDPRQAFGPDKIIPPQILANAKVRFGLSPTLPELQG
jgi:lipid-binding SYLF domain-containing protein